MANVLATNLGEFGAVADFFETVGTASLAAYSNLGWSNGNGQSLQCGNNSNTAKTVPAAAEYYIHFRLKWPGTTNSFFQVREGSTVHVTFDYNSAKQIVCKQGNGTTLFTTTATYDNTVAHDIQLHIKVNDATGSVELRVDGNTSNDGSFSGDTRNGGTSGVIDNLNWASTTGQTQMSDLTLNDTTGSAETSWTGPVRVVLGVPNANGASGVQFTPSAGSNFQNVDDTIPGANNGDTDYNEDSTAGHKDFFSWPSSVFTGMTPASINYVRFKYWPRATDGGSHTTRGNAKNGGTTVNGTTVTIGASFTRLEDIFYTDPATSAAWASFAAIYGSEFGYELVS